MRRALAAAVLVAAACHSAKRAPVAPVALLGDAGVPDAGWPADPDAARAEAAWSRRAASPAALDEAIALWERIALRSADPAPALLDAARARKLRFEVARRAAEADAGALLADTAACAADAHRSWSAQFPAAAAMADGVHGASDVYAQLGKGAAEALYLEAFCSAAWARLQGFTPLIERHGELAAAFQRVAQLVPDLDGAGAERELGTLLAALPSYAGGDLQEARRHLDAAVARAPHEARNRLALARTVAVKAQDRALFEEQLAVVMKGDDPAAAAEASALLARADDLFGPAEAAQKVPGGTQK